jgi:hypothetical protein
VPYCQQAQATRTVLVLAHARAAECMTMYRRTPPLLGLQWPPQLIKLPKLLAYFLLLRQMLLHLLSVATMIAAHSKHTEHSIFSREQECKIACKGRRGRDVATGASLMKPHIVQRWLLAGHISTSLAGAVPWTWRAHPGPVPAAAQTAVHALTGALMPCADPVAWHELLCMSCPYVLVCSSLLQGCRMHDPGASGLRWAASFPALHAVSAHQQLLAELTALLPMLFLLLLHRLQRCAEMQQLNYEDMKMSGKRSIVERCLHDACLHAVDGASVYTPHLSWACSSCAACRRSSSRRKSNSSSRCFSS